MLGICWGATRLIRSDVVQTLSNIQQALSDRDFGVDEHHILSGIVASIESCRDLVMELQLELRKFDKASGKSLRTSITTVGRHAIYPLRRSTLLRLEEDVDLIRDNISFAIDGLQIRDGLKTHNDLTDMKALLSLVRTSQISREMIEWLQAPDASVDYNQACKKSHTNTGSWLINSSEVRAWLLEGNSFLWLYGFPGSGKSVLISIIISHTVRQRKSRPRTGIAFFYFSFAETAKQNASGMLRALVFQLSNQLDDGHSDLSALYVSCSNFQPTTFDLLQTLKVMIGKFDNAYLFVDALDESPQNIAREEVLDTLADIRGSSIRSCHVFVTSRDVPDVRDRIASYGNCISMKNDAVNEDIARYIVERLQTHTWSQRRTDYRHRIRDVLTERAHGK